MTQLTPRHKSNKAMKKAEKKSRSQFSLAQYGARLQANAALRKSAYGMAIALGKELGDEQSLQKGSQ